MTSLVSVDLVGQDRRVHVTTRDADTSELRVSPDLRWIAFRDRQQYYVARYRETGSPFVLDATGDVLPVARVSELGGYGLALVGGFDAGPLGARRDTRGRHSR